MTVTARQEYTNTRLEIAKELKKLEQRLFEHNRDAKRNLHWEHVGDMKHILSQLKELNLDEELE